MSVAYNPPMEDGFPAHEGDYDELDVDADAAAEIWSAVQDANYLEWSSCDDNTTGELWIVEIDDGVESRLARCADALPPRWQALREALEENSQSNAEEWNGEWPFNGEYWQDELGYYRTTK